MDEIEQAVLIDDFSAEAGSLGPSPKQWPAGGGRSCSPGAGFCDSAATTILAEREAEGLDTAMRGWLAGQASSI
jgi:hypothetical protein